MEVFSIKNERKIDRFDKYMKVCGLNDNRVTEQLGLSVGTIGKSRKEGRDLSPKVIEKILNFYRNLSRTWLIVGEGSMLKDQESNVTFAGRVAPAMIEDTVAVRYFEVTPTATFQEFCEGMNETPDMINIYPEFNEVLDDSYCAFNVWGDSMAPQIHSKSRVLCREIPPTRWHNLSDCVVVIAYADKFVVKRIVVNHLSSENYIILASDNPDYPDRDTVQLADIRAIFRAERILSSKII